MTIWKVPSGLLPAHTEQSKRAAENRSKKEAKALKEAEQKRQAELEARREKKAKAEEVRGCWEGWGGVLHQEQVFACVRN